MMRCDGTTGHMDRNYQANSKPPRNRLHFDKQFPVDLKTFMDRVPREFWGMAEEHPFGEPRCHPVPGIGQVSLSSIEFAWSAWRLWPYLKRAKRVVEIGGGYGGMARMILSHFPRVELTIVDLAPMLAIQRYYLENTGIDVGRVTFAQERVPMLTGQFDLAVATKVMCELDPDEVNNHLKDLDDVLAVGAPFYVVHHRKCINRMEDWQVPAWGSLMEERFPFEVVKNWWERIWQKQVVAPAGVYSQDADETSEAEEVIIPWDKIEDDPESEDEDEKEE
ncbi:MAG: putative sugar O-methyltransferase [bacterium]|nr:putative sugar O-methyltransferase [bacterium]